MFLLPPKVILQQQISPQHWPNSILFGRLHEVVTFMSLSKGIGEIPSMATCQAFVAYRATTIVQQYCSLSRFSDHLNTSQCLGQEEFQGRRGKCCHQQCWKLRLSAQVLSIEAGKSIKLIFYALPISRPKIEVLALFYGLLWTKYDYSLLSTTSGATIYISQQKQFATQCLKLMKKSHFITLRTFWIKTVAYGQTVLPDRSIAN